MHPSPARTLSRLDGIDLLRGLGIFLVLMNHVNMRLRIAKIPYYEGLNPQLVSSLFWNGQRGVQIFFAVSGFLITATTLRRWEPLYAIDIPGFYRHRFARIAPLLLLLLTILSALHFAQLPDFTVGAKTGGLGRALSAALTFHINVLEANRGYLPANWDILWSLSVEEVFYLFFPVVCRTLGRGKALLSLLIVLVIAGPFSRTILAQGNGVWREYSYLGGMDAIALGCMTALLVRDRQFSRRTLAGFTAAGLALVIFILCFPAPGLYRTGLDMTILALGTCLLIVAAAKTNWRSPALLRPLAKLGQLSYEVYLTHMFIVFVFFDFFRDHGEPFGYVPALFVTVIATAALTGQLVSRTYSEPLNRLLRCTNNRTGGSWTN